MGSQEKKKRSTVCSHLPETALQSELPAGRADCADSSGPADDESGRQATTSSVQKCDACVKERKAARVYRTKIMAGLLLPFTVGAFDTTVYVVFLCLLFWLVMVLTSFAIP
jgi:hypothetical protein